MRNNMNANTINWAMCIDCEWQGDVNLCEWDSEYNEHYGKEFKYPICPKCCGGVEVSSITIDLEVK